LLESPAYRVLSLSAHRALARIEIEFAHHGGNDNGRLPVTFDDFVKYGVRRHSIAPSLDELETLGFIKITERGRKAKGVEYRRPNLFLLTTRPELDGVGPERCRWRRFKSIQEAEAALKGVQTRRKNLKPPSAETALKASAETAPMRPNPQCRNGTTTDGRNGTTIYISGGDHASDVEQGPTKPAARLVWSAPRWVELTPPVPCCECVDAGLTPPSLATPPVADALPRDHAPSSQSLTNRPVPASFDVGRLPLGPTRLHFASLNSSRKAHA
jgi:hypothetical protein